MADIRILQNTEKIKHQRYGDENHPLENFNVLNFTQPFRFLTVSQPNCGKTTTIIAILMNLKPVPKNIFILHPESIDMKKKILPEEGNTYYINNDIKQIEEYAGIKCIYLSTLPSLKFMKQYKKDLNLIIIDDVNIRQLINKSNYSQAIYDKMLSYGSTHYNFSILQSFQNLFQQAVPAAYRYSQILLMFKYDDIFMARRLMSSFGVVKSDSTQILDLLKKNNDGHNSILINNQPGAPYKYLLNLKNVLADPDSDSDSD